ncbi:type II and III secretion system protein family protein [Candidatus Burkholderia verschuerenii]|uniref:type II and III secretion system protein family protein n=1 Tax=Candidatus Burkholderia verschuerenii TaxID=242163 RepID=UPI000A7EDC8D|nr:type II and III secretion system protein family protein [Candidatus Burkholderia verschuerenii]
MKSRFGTFQLKRLAPLAIVSLPLLAVAVTTPASALDLRDGRAVNVDGKRVMPKAMLLQGSATSGAQLNLTAGKGVMLTLTQNAASVFVADPTVADVSVPVPRVLYVLGKKPGTTTLYVLNGKNHPIVRRTVMVTPNLDALRATLNAHFPNADLKLSAGPGSIQVTGHAKDSAEADTMVQMVQPYLAEKQNFVNRIVIDKPLQVQLHVRITEVDRSVTQQLGINWYSLSFLGGGNFYGGLFNGSISLASLTSTATSTTGSAYSIAAGAQKAGINAIIDALTEEDLLTTLAEPNLVALSGETASFLAGGEFPIPISQTNGAVVIDYKTFGVKLDFTPTVLNDRRISLKVRPEVSQLDSTASITTGGISIPGMSVRRADTTVELASGQSFAIAGLLQANSSNTLTQIPGLGSLPIIGKLFSSKNFQNKKTEIVIIVTPYLVNPVDPTRLRDPISSLVRRASDVEYGFARSRSGTPTDTGAPQPTLTGPAGYVY